MRTALTASISLHLGIAGSLFVWAGGAAVAPMGQRWVDVVWLPGRASLAVGAPDPRLHETGSGSLAPPSPPRAPEAPIIPVSVEPAPRPDLRSMPPPVPVLDRAAAPSSTGRNQPPAYPEAARQAGMQGTVALLVRVGADGSAQSVVVVLSSGFALLDRAALAAVSGWVFQPALRAGVPVAGQAPVGLRFALVDPG